VKKIGRIDTLVFSSITFSSPLSPCRRVVQSTASCLRSGLESSTIACEGSRPRRGLPDSVDAVDCTADLGPSGPCSSPALRHSLLVVRAPLVLLLPSAAPTRHPRCSAGAPPILLRPSAARAALPCTA
jgi:hypothetical protein